MAWLIPQGCFCGGVRPPGAQPGHILQLSGWLETLGISGCICREGGRRKEESFGAFPKDPYPAPWNSSAWPPALSSVLAPYPRVEPACLPAGHCFLKALGEGWRSLVMMLLPSHCPRSHNVVHCGIYTVATRRLTSANSLLPHHTPITGTLAPLSSSPG